MGIRVQFWLGAADGITTHFLNAPLSEFIAWYHTLIEDYPEELVPGVSELILEVIQTGESALLAETQRKADTIDRMIDLFYGSYCDGIRPDLLQEAEGSMLYVQRYEKHKELIGAQCGAMALEYWEHLLAGRGIGRQGMHYPYRSLDGVFRIGYWTFDECESLQRLMTKNLKGQLESKFQGDRYIDIQASYRALKCATENEVGLILTVA
ncbi:MAG: hypothetical protein AB1757_15930 [Acidobacteriota bacterium]